MARIDPVDPDAVPADKRDLLDTLSTTDPADRAVEHSLEGGTLNVYRTLGRSLSLLEGFRAYASVVWNAGDLDALERETVILATSRRAESAYEWHQHVRVALDEGMAPDRILAISRSNAEALPEAHAALVAYVDAFVEGSVTDAIHERLAGHFDDETILGVGMLAGLYLGLARVLQALEVEPESPFVGWELERL